MCRVFHGTLHIVMPALSFLYSDYKPINIKSMAEEYIGSQQHFEDCINEHYDQKERYEKEMNAQMEKDYYKDMEKQYNEDMEKQHYGQLISDSAEKPNYNSFCKSKNCPHYIEWQCYGVLVSCKLVGESTNIETYPNDCPFIDEIKLVSF